MKWGPTSMHDKTICSALVGGMPYTAISSIFLFIRVLIWFQLTHIRFGRKILLVLLKFTLRAHITLSLCEH